jgi:predicted nucleotidyltransferase component of viral defense system
MTAKSSANLPASVHQRLLNLSQQRGEEFNRLLTLFAIERFLYRLSQSPHAERFILKGALLWLVWAMPDHRPTRDLDLLGFGDNSPVTLAQIFQEICVLSVVADGVDFDHESIKVHQIRSDQEYHGQRIELRAYLGKARVQLQIDIGFGDLVAPAPVLTEYPTLLAFPPPHLRVYSKESVIAEKLHAMVTLDLSNSRMKDFYDLWTLSRLFSFDGTLLIQAIRVAFTQRNTALPTQTPTALTADFANNPIKRTQWHAFLNRNRLAVRDASFAEIIADLARFLWPPLSAAAHKSPFSANWMPQGDWHSR